MPTFGGQPILGPPNPALLVGYLGGPPPRFTGLPLSASEASEFWALQQVAAHPVQKLKPWELEALRKWTGVIEHRLASRLRTLPGDALPTWADKYSHEHLPAGRVWDVEEWASEPPTDEFGRDYPGKSPDLAELASEIATYAAGYIPGAGPWVVTAIQVAQGKSLEDAVIAGLRAALPGGPIAAAAFDFGVALAMGASVDQAALETLWSQYPDTRAAFELGKLALGAPADVARLDQAAAQWPAYKPLIGQAAAHGTKAPAPVNFLLLTKSLTGKPVAAKIAAVPVVPSAVRAHRATVSLVDRSWPVAGAALGLIPLGVVLGRVLGKLWPRD